MPGLQVRRFTKADLPLLDVSPEIQALFNKALQHSQNKPFAAVVELPYGSVAWTNQQQGFKWPDNVDLGEFGRSCAPVVAMVTKRTMEVYETVQLENSTQRRSTTVILRPGDWFGLFEAYAKWQGPWTIVSGVVSFLPCNPIGINDWTTSQDRKKVQVGPDSVLEFDEVLVPNGSYREAWISESVWVKPDLIKDSNVKNQLVSELRRKTIRQLRSVLNQSPTWRRIGEKDGIPRLDHIKAYLWMQYLKSVIDGDIPIFQLAGQQDEIYFPIETAVNILSSLTCRRAKTGKEKLPATAVPLASAWEILIPKILERNGRGIHPVAYVPRFPAGGEECLLRWSSSEIARFAKEINCDITFLNEGTNHDYYARVHFGESAFVTVCSSRESNKHPIDLLADDGQNRAWKWHRHLNRVVIIEKYEPDS